jgi:predicted N-formylglutamate amidohydrolase
MDDDFTTASATASLLGRSDPPVFEVFNPEKERPILLICDHASQTTPEAMSFMGLQKSDLDDHIAWDIGAAQVTRKLAEHLGARAVLANYSRLVIDANRQPGDPESIPSVSDGISIPKNDGLTEEDEIARANTFFWPYHQAISDSLAHLWRLGLPPYLLSIHSFTPTLNGSDRFWDVGVLWNRDFRLARPLLRILNAYEGLKVGDNEPYSGLDMAYSIDLHAAAAGLPNVAIEIRQDHLETEEGIKHWSLILGDALEEILANDDLHQVEHF